MTDPRELKDIFVEEKDYLDRWVQNRGIMEMLGCLRGTRVNIIVHQIQDANQFNVLYILPKKKFSTSGGRPALGEVKPSAQNRVFARLMVSSCSVSARLVGS